MLRIPPSEGGPAHAHAWRPIVHAEGDHVGAIAGGVVVVHATDVCGAW